MSADDDNPVYACRCLNIRFYIGKSSDSASNQQQSPGSSAEYLLLFVGDKGIKISHNELTLRTRSRVATDSSSPTGRTQQTLVTCLVCDTDAYRAKADVPPEEDAKEGPILPTEDWAERETLRSKSGYVEVHVGRDGCITEDEIKQRLSSSSYSHYFSLAVPTEEHMLSTSAPPVLPQARITIPPEHSFLPSLPPFLPPPPFTPSHPVFLHLSSIVTARSNDARRDSERRIEEFVRQELAHLEEHESTLRRQLERVWWIVKERLKKAEQERDANLLLALRPRRRSMSPRRDPSSPTGGEESFVVRNFVPSTYHTPRAIHASNSQPSALSASLATTSFHHPRAQQANAIQSNSTDASANHAPLTPSPPPYSTSSPSLRDSFDAITGSMVGLSRSLRRNMDKSNDTAVTYRYYVIEEQEAEHRKAKERAQRTKSSEANAVPKDTHDSDKSANREDAGKPAVGKDVKTEKAVDSSALGDQRTSPRKKDGRRKVTFNIEPNVVTIKRDITAEKDDEELPEKGEDLLFDMDGVSETSTTEREVQPTGEETQQEKAAELVFHEMSERSQRSVRRQKDLKDAGLPQSFVALRPSSLPAPSNVRPPIRSRANNDNGLKQVDAPAPSSSGSGASQARDIKQQPSEGDSTEGVLSPEQKDFLKLVAADTPSHRGLWKPGSDAWKIFDRNSRHTSSAGRNASEDEEEDAQTNGTNANSTDLDWRHYRRPDIVGSLPIPMAPISQQIPGGSLSLRPKTSLTERPGTLVPPLTLPTVAEEGTDSDEGKGKKSAAAIRREVYSERNKTRGLDPGFLDFATDDGDEDDEEDGETGTPSKVDEVEQISTSRSRQHALKIIRSRNAVPPEGLWRSLVT